MKFKRCMILFLLLIAMLLFSGRQTREQDKGNRVEKNGQEILVWRITAPMSMQEAGDELIAVWQEPLNELLEKKGAGYSVRIEAIATATDEPAEEVLQTADELEKLRNAGEQTDLVSIRTAMQNDALAGYHLVYLECVKRDLLLPLDDFICSEKGKLLRESVTEWDLERAKLNGTAYGFSAVLPAMGSTLYTEEILKKYGIQESELTGSVFDKEALLQKIRDRSGEAPYGVITGEIRHLLGLWIVEPTSNVALGKNGKFINVTETPEFRQYLTRFADWKKKGLVELIGGTRKEMYFAIDGNASDMNFNDRAYHAKPNVYLGIGKQSQVPVLVVPDETVMGLSPYWGGDLLCITSWTQKEELAKDFMIRLMSDSEIANLIQYGRRGQDYRMEQNILEASEEASYLLEAYEGQYTNPLITYSKRIMADDKLEYAKRYHEAYEKEVPDGFRFDPIPVLEQIAATNRVYDSISGCEAAKKIYNLEVDDVDQVIADITAELKAAGIDEVVEEANRQLEEWKKGKNIF